MSNGYPRKFITDVQKRQRKTDMIPEPEELVREFFASVDSPTTSSGYAVLDTSLTRVLRKYDIKASNKPVRTPQQDFPSPKDRPKIKKQANVVYKIGCKDCSWSYVGETGRCFETRKNKHIRNVKQNTAGSNMAKHFWANDHTINFEDGQVIDRGNYRTRKTLESWHTAVTAESDNNSKPLPEQYRILLNKI